ncbi:MAG: energy transducer TonB [Acidobacteria bacterium]|nr:energy transducer TonB [Acidobacteriota bacterium]
MTKLIRLLLCTVILAGSLGATDQRERAVLHRVEPEYPEVAKRMNIHGAVKLRIWIKPDGTVYRLEYIGGHPVLAEASLKAVKAWKYAAADKETTTVLEFKF